MIAGNAGFPIEACLAPLMLLVIVAGMFVIARVLQTRAQGDLEQMRGDWRRFDTTRRQIEGTLQAFQEDVQEPFYSRLNELRMLLVEIDRQAVALRTRRVDLKQQANNLSASYLRAVMGAAVQWFQLRREIGRLRRDMDRAWQALSAAGEKEQEIRRLGWNIAQQARRLQRLQRQTRQALDGLHAKNMHGDPFDAAQGQEQALRLTLEKIPNYFFNGSEEALLAQMDREAIVYAHTTVEAVRPEIDALLAQVQEWEKSFTRANEAADLLRRALDDLEATMKTLPAGVETAENHKNLKAMRQIAATLQSTLGRPEVGSLDELYEEAGRQTRLAQEQTHALKRARREAAALESALTELPAAFKDLSLELATLGAKSVHPVTWRSSVDTLTELNRKANGLGATNTPRPPEQIADGLKTAAELRRRQKELAAHIREVSEAHTELVDLLASPDFARLEGWLEETRRLMEKIAEFAPENWSRAEAVDSLSADIDALAEARQQLEIARPAAAIPENEMVDRLAAVREFAERYTAIQRRVEASRTRLDELTAVETAAREQIEAAGTALGQIDFVVDTNEYLGGIAAQDIERFSAEVKRLSADLGERQRGKVDHKARQTETLVERIETNANRWLDQLIRESRQSIEELSGLLRELDEIASLEEKPVVEARRLLSSGAGLSTGGYAARSNYALEEVLPELKRRSDYWHSCNAAIRALEDFHPLIETYQEAMYHRDQAQHALSEAASQVRQKRAWPPTTVTFDTEWQEMEKIDDQMQALRDSSAKAIARTAQLGNLATRYQALADRVKQAAERAARERTEVEEVEAQINELAELWRNHRHQYDSNPEAGSEIQALLEDIHTLLAQIRRQYIQGGADFQGTLQSMKTLHKRVRYYQVALDDESALDVQGNVHRRRESRRV